MQLNTLSSRTKRVKPAPVGRGGRRGKTSGRGTKGQRARAGHKIRPEIRDLIKKLPKRRGHGKNRSRTVRSHRTVFAVVSIRTLNATYVAGEVVSPATLLAKGLVRRTRGRAPAVKIVGPGSFAAQLTIEKCALSAPARAALSAVGGTHRGTPEGVSKSHNA